jgi:hypothetical protein
MFSSLLSVLYFRKEFLKLEILECKLKKKKKKDVILAIEMPQSFLSTKPYYFIMTVGQWATHGQLGSQS